MWDSNLHGEPGGRFKPKAASRSAAGAVHEPVDPDAAWACEDALKKMRNAVAKRREQHRREIDVVAAAFVAHAGVPRIPVSAIARSSAPRGHRSGSRTSATRR